MRILFWNIGPRVDNPKLPFIASSITGIVPDIICLAEGTPSQTACDLVVTEIESLGYSTFYHPNLSTKSVIGGQYGYNKLGLKVFHKSTISGNSNFTFADQQAEGRILHFRFKNGNDFYSCFFIHNMSLAGDEISQYDFLFKLRMCIDSKRRLHNNDKFFIVGDFNLQPWNRLLRDKKILETYFFQKEHSFYNNSNKKNLYFNPFFEYVQSHPNPLMIGTFFNKKYNSFIDFGIFSEGMNNFDIEVLDTINGISMLSQTGNKIMVHNDFDHLPISIKFK